MYQVIADTGRSQFGNIMYAASGGKIMMLNIRKILTDGCQRFCLIIKPLVYQGNKNAFKKLGNTHLLGFISAHINI